MIRVMVVDDSPLVRKIATDILNSDPEIEVVATASTAEFALKKLSRVNPDVITMDIEMPGMGGIEAIRRIMSERPTPIVVLSAFAKRGAELTLQALESGAVDFILKPSFSMSGGINDISSELIEKVRNAARIEVSKIKDTLEGKHVRSVSYSGIVKKTGNDFKGSDYKIVAFGTSTGGPVALKEVLSKLPQNFPVGIVVVQHMPPVFTRAFAGRLDSICQLEVREAIDGDLILPGRVLIAPGDYHMTVLKDSDKSFVKLHKWDPVSGHRPSVDVLMHSVAREYGSSAIAVIMTGMGRDGAEGIKELKSRGGWIISQDRDSSVIFGMNGEVIKNGDADEIVPLNCIADSLIKKVGMKLEIAM